MSGSVTYRCPECGQALEFDIESQMMHCRYCGNHFTQDEAVAAATKEAQIQQHLRTYTCDRCGVEMVTDDTTVATRCFYCRQPIVLRDKLSGDFRPESIIPFTVTREEAREKFCEFVSAHRFADKRLLGDENLQNFEGVYIPYWIGDFELESTFRGTVSYKHMSSGNTEVYRVTRESGISLKDKVVRGLAETDPVVSDGVQPYDMSARKPFSMEYLSGFQARVWNVSREQAEQTMRTEVNEDARNIMLKRGESSVTARGDVHTEIKDRRIRYCLLPIWMITYGGRNGTKHFFMVNGQTGTTCGYVPVNRKRLLINCSILGAAVTAALCLGGAFVW